MKIRKGFPQGISFIKENVRELVLKLHQLSNEDLKEVDAFVEYLINGPTEIKEDEEKDEPSKMYDFMDGGFNRKS